MPHTIQVSDETFTKLQALAQPFVDTPESVIMRLADAALRFAEKSDRSHRLKEGVIKLDPNLPSSLAHTRVLFAKFGKHDIDRPNWNRLLKESHAAALKKLGSLDELKRATGANLKDGRYEQEGFSYIPEGNFSIQGLDSNLSWQNSLRMAKRLSVPIEVEFVWHDKDAASHPGKSGWLHWMPEDE